MRLLEWLVWSWFGLQATVLAQNLYDSDPHIIELTPKSFDKVVHGTNYTTLVEFYAPWCGYCQQLKGIMKKAGKVLDGVAQVASVNCDVAKNKKLCGQYKVQGFPTLMVFRPPKVDVSKPVSERLQLRNHASEVYQGVRKLSPMVDFVLSRIKNYVRRINGTGKLCSILEGQGRKSLVLFSKRDKVSPIYRAVALDWLGVFDCFTIPNSKLSGLAEDNQLATTNPQISQFLQETIPLQMTSEESMLVAFDTANDQYQVIQCDSFTKPQISRALSAAFNVTPMEGPLSKREQYLHALRTGSKKSQPAKKIHDEL
ncbi:hypothetical protein HG536_0D01570 [Torulaspora globosa]|uniref:Thioredoxin domain-containing protein n=1 Tax=Torulaspora globosa TaxID=48254 RepID=A0A7G3ZGJ9_9SACH|nr:uncharacterized protein HG536_0D01570 [Torulaspora globosa]QLL32635.1 hypothetical protein HG536_0D01570 [Torulaspora globosa]